MTDKTLSLNSS